MIKKQNLDCNHKFTASHQETPAQPSALLCACPRDIYVYNVQIRNHIMIKTQYDLEKASYDKTIGSRHHGTYKSIVSNTDDTRLDSIVLAEKLSVPFNCNIETTLDRIELVNDAEQGQSTLVSHTQLTYDVSTTEIDIYQVLETIENTYNSIRELLNEAKKPMRMKQKQQSKMITIKIDKLLSFGRVKLQHSLVKNTREFNNQEIVCFPNSRPAIAELSPATAELSPATAELLPRYTNPREPFHNYMEQKCMTCCKSIMNFNVLFMNFFMYLVFLYRLCRLPIAMNHPSNTIFGYLYRRDWHVTSAAHGYFLAILLKNCNFTFVNVTRELYIVIIKNDTPRLVIKLNFKMRNCVFMAYDVDYVENYLFELTHWNNEHREILSKSGLSSALFKPRKRPIYALQNATVDARVSKTPSYCYSSSTLKSTAASREAVDVNASNCSSISIQSKSDVTIIAISSSNSTIPSAHTVLDVSKASGDSHCREPPKIGLEASMKQLSTMWLSKLHEKCLKFKSMVGMSHLRSDYMINETMFGNVALDEYLEPIGSLWVLFTSAEFRAVFLKQLGCTIVCTIL